MMTGRIHFNSPQVSTRVLSWTDSFAVESDVCPLSPRYRNLSRRPSLRRRVSHQSVEGEKENEVTPSVEDNFLNQESIFSPRTSNAHLKERIFSPRSSKSQAKERIFSPRSQKASQTFFNRGNSNGAVKPVLSVKTCRQPEQLTFSASTDESPSHIASEAAPRKFTFECSRSISRTRACSDSFDDVDEVQKLTAIFSPRPMEKRRSRNQTDQSETSSKLTVFDLLKNRERSTSN